MEEKSYSPIVDVTTISGSWGRMEEKSYSPSSILPSTFSNLLKYQSDR
jgi:hypothetical protein